MSSRGMVHRATAHIYQAGGVRITCMINVRSSTRESVPAMEHWNVPTSLKRYGTRKGYYLESCHDNADIRRFTT